MADISKQCTLTNNSGKDVVITLDVPPNETTSAGASVNANSTMEILKTTGGATVISSSGTGTVTLDHPYKSNGDTTGYVQYYDLIAADSNWLYPFASFPVSQQTSNNTTGYAPQTIPSDNTAMTQAFKFYQTLAAYPASGLAKAYTTALQAAQDAALAKADGSAGAAAAAATTDGLANYWNMLLHPQTLKDWVISIATFTGAVLLLPALGGAVYGIYRVIKYKQAVKETLTKQILEYTTEEWRQIQSDGLVTRNGNAIGRFLCEVQP